MLGFAWIVAANHGTDYDFITPVVTHFGFEVIRYTDGKPPRTIYRRPMDFTEMGARDAMLQSDIISVAINQTKTEVLLPRWVSSSNENGQEVSRIAADIIDLRGNHRGTLKADIPSNRGYASFEWLDSNTAAIVINTDPYSIVTKAGTHQYGSTELPQSVASRALDPSGSDVLQYEASMETPFSSEGPLIPQTGRSIAVFWDSTTNTRLVWSSRRYCGNWSGRRAYYSVPADTPYQYPRPAKFPFVVARLTNRDFWPWCRDLDYPWDPWIRSDLYLINLHSGDVEYIGPGTYAISLIRQPECNATAADCIPPSHPVRRVSPPTLGVQQVQSLPRAWEKDRGHRPHPPAKNGHVIECGAKPPSLGADGVTKGAWVY